MAPPLKRPLQRAVRLFHVALLDRGLPHKAALCFHALEPPHHAAFREVVGYFRGAGYRFAHDPHDFLLSHGRTAWLSFDDNYRSWHAALPLLAELGVAATFYVTTGVFRDRADEAAIAAYFDRVRHDGERLTLTVDELRALAEAGHTIGAHTHTHLPLSALEPKAAQAEIRESKEELERVLGRPVRHFSYPFGRRRFFSERLRAYCRGVGFETIANAIPALQHAPQHAEALQRQLWRLDRPLEENLANLRVDGRLFERLTGRSAIG